MYDAADRLTDAARRRERGAFFGSIHGTLNHLLWADRMWMSRFAGTPRPSGGIPDSTGLHADWAELRAASTECDDAIVRWTEALRDDWVAGSMTWFSGAAGREITKSRALLLLHFFNHQTHHRGQVHCMLSQAGTSPQVSDLWLMPDAP